MQRSTLSMGGVLRGPLERLGVVYKPALLAQAEMRYYNRKYNLDYTRRLACLVPEPSVSIDWDIYLRPPLPSEPDATPAEGARYQPLPVSLSNARGVSALKSDFLDWAYRNSTIYIRGNEALKIYCGPAVREDEFHRQVSATVSEAMQAEIDKTAAGFDQKLEALNRKIEKQQLIVDRRQDTVDNRKAEQTSSDFELLASVFTRRKRSLSTSISKRRMTQQARGEYNEARKILDQLQVEWKALAAERQITLQRIQTNWQERAGQVSQIPVTPLKKDLFAPLFGVAWLPYYQVKNPDGVIELAAF